ncbi:hypothetical protein LCGC14_1821740 [marine sediment metagenome]|uniref:Uncharacterized protein n=1 Tax=marine sediment metagenome TaxID=412755 RepID=A0A0F9GIQ0_9ZZZZ
MDKIEELVEWVAGRMRERDMHAVGYTNYVEDGKNTEGLDLELAKEILSHPDLALIDRRNYNAFNKAEVPKLAELAMIVPLAEALKEVRNNGSR